MPKITFEREVKEFLKMKEVSYIDYSNSYKKPDFVLLSGEDTIFHLEVKEKKQHYALANWPKMDYPEKDYFILDDLTVRKCLAYSPASGVLVRDNLQNRYLFFSVVTIALMPRHRVNRTINRNQPGLKGKWIINLINGENSNNLEEAFAKIGDYLLAQEKILFETIECYGEFQGEEIGEGGITRKPEHWETDIRSTR